MSLLLIVGTPPLNTLWSFESRAHPCRVLLPEQQVSSCGVPTNAECVSLIIYLIKMRVPPFSRFPVPVLFSILSILFWSSLFFLLYACYQCLWQRKKNMAGRLFLALGAFCTSLATVYGQSSTSAATASSTESFRSIFTVPADADASVPLIPNIYVSVYRHLGAIRGPGKYVSDMPRTPKLSMLKMCVPDTQLQTLLELHTA